MARLDHVHPAMRAALLAMACPTFDTQPWVGGPALSQRRVALISTAGLHRRDDRPFAVTSGNARAIAGDYRVIPNDIAANDLVMSHVSTNFDRTGFQQDWNVVFPLDRHTFGQIAFAFRGRVLVPDPDEVGQTCLHERFSSRCSRPEG